MKPRPSIRKTVKWGGAVVSVILLVVWVGSGWWQRRWYISGNDIHGSYVSIREGRLDVGKIDIVWEFLSDFGPGRLIGPVEPHGFKWWFHAHHNAIGTYFGTPLWTLAAIALAVTGCAWRLDTLARRRARVGFCPKCRYNRAGLAASVVCPECGSPAPGRM